MQICVNDGYWLGTVVCPGAQRCTFVGLGERAIAGTCDTEDDPPTWYLDADGDGAGSPKTSPSRAASPPAWLCDLTAGDCADGDATITSDNDADNDGVCNQRWTTVPTTPNLDQAGHSTATAWATCVTPIWTATASPNGDDNCPELAQR